MATETVNVNATAITAAITAEAAARVAGDAASVATAASDATTKANAAQASAIASAASDATTKANAAQAAAIASASSDATTKANAAQAAAIASASSDATTKANAAQAAAIAASAQRASNLSDLANVGTARTNLGLGTLATQSGTFSGTSSGTNTGDQDLSTLVVKANNLNDLASVATARTNLGVSASEDIPIILYGAAATLINQPNALNFFLNALTLGLKLNLSRYTQVKFQAGVGTASASVNTPKVILRYRTSYSAVTTDYSDIGTSEVSIPLTAVGNPDTGWINLAGGAIANDVFVRVLMSGGNGADDPVVGPLLMFLR